MKLTVINPVIFWFMDTAMQSCDPSAQRGL